MELSLLKRIEWPVAVLAAAMCFLGAGKLGAQNIEGDAPAADSPDEERVQSAPDSGETPDKGDRKPEDSEESSDGEPSSEEPGFSGVELPGEDPMSPDAPAGEAAPISPTPAPSSVSGGSAVGTRSPVGTALGHEPHSVAGGSAATTHQEAAPALGGQGGGGEVDTSASASQSAHVGMMGQEQAEDEEHEFMGLTIAPEVGYIFFPKSELTVNGFKATVQPRNGFVAKVHLDLGGDGIAFELAPFFAVEAGGIDAKGGDFGDMSIDLKNGLAAGSFQAVGGQMGLVWRFSAGRFYPSFGLGFHGAYLMGDAIDYGLELYGRIPVGFTVYLAERLGLVVEAGFMFGVTGIRTPLDWSSLESAGLSEQAVADAKGISSEQDLTNWLAQYKSEFENLDPNAADDYQGIDAETATQDIVMNQLADSLRFGVGFGIDLMVGLRFP